jgi:hypothetical protein
MEKMWLMLSITTFIIALYQTFINSVFDALYFYGFSVIAIFLFFMRKSQRISHEKKNAKQDD